MGNMNMHERDGRPRQLDDTPPTVSASGRLTRRLPHVLRGLMGVPLLVLASIAAITIVNRQPIPTLGPEISLRASGGGVTALVFGAGSGVHLLRVSDPPAPVAADLARGALHIIALNTVELRAANLGDTRTVRLTARGPVIALRQDGARVAVHTGF